MTLPDGTVVNLITVVGGGVVPCVGGTADDAAMPGGRGDCFPTRTQHLSACIGYTTNDADLVGGFWTTSVTYVNWFDHVGVNDTQNTSGGITNNVPVPADLCDEEGTGECQGDATCDFQTGTCTPPANIPGPCTDTDNNECTIAQCEAGVCDQTNPVSNGSACDDFNGQFDALCASQSCQAGECVLDTETNEGDPCTEDASECTADLCVEGICEHPPLDPLPEECRGDFICRTCGFWGNHPDIVQELLDNADPPIQVCGGEEMDTTEPEDNSSANEAICVKVKGKQYRQLARQLTCLALNCEFSNTEEEVDALVSRGILIEPNVCTGQTAGGQDLEALFAECDAACEADSNLVNSCIDRVDCINNGGTPVQLPDDSWTCALGECSLDDELCGLKEGNCATDACVEDQCRLSGDPCTVNADCTDTQFCELFEAQNCHQRDVFCPGEEDSFCVPQDSAETADCKGSRSSSCTYADVDCD